MDVLLQKLGNPGKFQVIMYFCLIGNGVIVLSNHIAMVFYAAKTRHHCVLNSEQSVTDWVPVVTRNNEKTWDGCHLYAGINKTKTVACNVWSYYLDGGETTIISEFDLVCDDAYKGDLATTIYFAGVMLGSIVLGYPADRYGRKPLLVCLLFCAGLFSLLIFFIAKSYVIFAIFRFLLGVTMQGINNATLILALEIFQIKYRAFCGVGLAVAASLGTMTFAMMTYLLQKWRHVQLFISTIPFVQLFLILWFTIESPRWLLLQGRFKEACVVINRVATFNNLPFPHNELDEIKCLDAEKTKQPKQKATAVISELFHSRILRTRTLILSLLWSVAAATYYSLVFNISFLFGDKYLNFCVGGVVDILVLLIILWTLARFGRKKPLVTTFFFSGISNIIALVTKLIKSEDNSVKIISTASALFGKSCAMGSISILYIFTAELYPTRVRTTALGINAVWARMGSMVAPQIFLLGLYTSDAVPYSIIAALSILCGLLVFLLPETSKAALPDSVMSTREVVKQSDSDTVLHNEATNYETNV